MERMTPWDQVARCAATSLDLDEPLAGSAPRTRAWLLVEHPGPWGHSGFADSDIPPDVVAEVDARASQLGIRIQLIRRHGREGRATPPATAFVARSTTGSSWARRFRVRSPEDLARLPLEAVGAETPPAAGEVVAAPLYLVCTHGRRDACCARLGRATVAALVAATTGSDDVWETTHTGGHRFASNVVVLPTGHVYGRVGPDDAAGLVDAHARGEVVAELLRGRSCDDPWGQVADVAVRRHLGVRGTDQVRTLGTAESGDDATVTVVVGEDRGVVTVALRRTPTGRARPFSCGDPGLRDPGRVEVRSIDRAGATA